MSRCTRGVSLKGIVGLSQARMGKKGSIFCKMTVEGILLGSENLSNISGSKRLICKFFNVIHSVSNFWQQGCSVPIQPLQRSYGVIGNTASDTSYQQRTLGTYGAALPFSGQTGRSSLSAVCPQPSCDCRGLNLEEAWEAIPSCSGCQSYHNCYCR